MKAAFNHGSLSPRCREYVPEDFTGALTVFDSNVPRFFSTRERAVFIDFLSNLPGPYFVLESDHTIVACGGYAIVPDLSRADLCWGMVERSLHGLGLGRLLTELRLDAAGADPRVSHIILNTSQHTRTFYEKLGFTTEKVTKDGFAAGLDRCDMHLRLS